jgi:Tfp pilus assembly protein PilV
MRFIQYYYDNSESTQNRLNLKRWADGFNMIELQVSLVILAAGLLSFAGLFRIYTVNLY